MTHLTRFSFSNTDFKDESTENNYQSLWSYNLFPWTSRCIIFKHLTETCPVRGSGDHEWDNELFSCRDMRYEEKSQSGLLAYLNVNMSISPPCVHTFMYVFKVTCKPGLSCVTEQKEFWRQYFVALTNSSSTVMLKYLFHVPSLHSGSTSEERTESLRWNTFEFAPFFF